MPLGVNWAKVRELRAMGWSLAKIGAEVGCSPSMAKRILDHAKAGKFHPGPTYNRGAMSAETADALDQLLNDGELDNSKIAAKLQIRIRSVRARRQALGLDNNPDSRAHLELSLEDRLRLAEQMIEDGEPHLAVKDIAHVSDRTLKKYFPGTAWTPQQCGRSAQMIHELNYIAASVYGVSDRGYVQQKSVSMGHRYPKAKVGVHS